MGDLVNIAKENGAVIARPGSDTSEVVMSPAKLQSTVEQVCKPLIEALDMVTKNAMLESGNSTTVTLAVWRLQECVMTLKEFRKLIGDIK